MHSALKLTLSTLALALTALAAPVQAQPSAAPAATAASGGTATPRIDRREARQQARIAQGAASGSLTPRETQRLEREQAAVNKAEDKAKADGTVTAKERRHLTHMQDRASRDIHHQKHDRQTAAGAAAAASK
jgi:hypothetical protein